MWKLGLTTGRLTQQPSVHLQVILPNAKGGLVCVEASTVTDLDALKSSRAMECAQELDITLPDFNDPSNDRATWRQWGRENPEDYRGIFNCAHQNVHTFNSDGTVNRSRMVERINEHFANRDEPALLQEMINRAQSTETCPQAEQPNQQGEYYRCVYLGCATS